MAYRLQPYTSFIIKVQCHDPSIYWGIAREQATRQPSTGIDHAPIRQTILHCAEYSRKLYSTVPSLAVGFSCGYSLSE